MLQFSYMFEETKPAKERYSPSVVFTNQPKISEHEVDKDFNKMRIDFIPHIEEFVASHELFADTGEVRITFAHEGVSSIVAVLETAERKVVLKIPSSKSFSAGEGLFLRGWEEAGVSVPHVIEEGIIHDYPFTLMEYIDAPTLDKKFEESELVKNKVYLEMGRTLRRMHSIKADGFGFVIDGKPEYRTVEEWLDGHDLKNRIVYAQEHGLLGDNQYILTESLGLIRDHAKKEGSTFCHDDFGTYNIFATEPITVFDTSPKFNNGYYDLGRVLFSNISIKGPTEARDQVLDGYFDDTIYDKRTIQAYTLLAFVMKFRYWHKTKKMWRIKNALDYFSSSEVL